MDFLKFGIAGELLVIITCNWYQTIPWTILRDLGYSFGLRIRIDDPEHGF